MDKVVSFDEYKEPKEREENCGYTEKELMEEYEEMCMEEDPRDDTDPYILEYKAAEAENELRRLNGLPPKHDLSALLFDNLYRILHEYDEEESSAERIPQKAEIIPFNQNKDRT